MHERERIKLLSSLSDHFLSPPNDLHHSSNIWIWGDTEVRCPSDRSTSVVKERSAHSEVPWHRTLDLSKEVFKLDQPLRRAWYKTFVSKEKPLSI